MGKATRQREQSARARIAAQRATEARRKRLLLTGGSVAVVIAVVATFIIVKALARPAADSGRLTTLAGVAQAITSVPAGTLNAVGAGTANTLEPTRGDQPLLTADGKPEMLYIGGEFCPFCAAERWALAVALSRFGTLSGLHFIHSSSTDEYPDTPTLTFYRSSYVSRYLVFTPVEWYTVNRTPLQPPTSAQQALFLKFNAPPYVSALQEHAFPFIDIGNRELIIGSQYLPSAFSGLTWAQVAIAIRSPSSAIAKDVDGAANTITAALCRLTHDRPGGVCGSPGVVAAGGGA
jgi:hypothetical protein